MSRRRYSRPRANPPQRYRQDDRPVAVAAVVALEAKDVIELRKMATDQEIPEVVDLSKDDLIQKLMEVNGADGGAGQDLFQTGILEIIDEGIRLPSSGPALASQPRRHLRFTVADQAVWPEDRR